MLRWSVEDALKWAVFSGDKNPIHFDQRVATSTGAEGITVHGMRAMWHLKQALAGGWSFSDENRGLQCAIRLRNPLIVAREYDVTVTTGCDFARGEIVDSVTGSICFSGKMSLKPLVTPDIGSLRMRKFISEADYSDYPLPGFDWCFLDAALFKMIVDAPESMEVVHRVLPELPANTLGEVFVMLPIVQTHHDVWLSEELLHRQLSELDIEGAMLPSLVMGDRSSGFILQMSAACFHQGILMMSTTVTLKIWPKRTSP